MNKQYEDKRDLSKPSSAAANAALISEPMISDQPQQSIVQKSCLIKHIDEVYKIAAQSPLVIHSKAAPYDNISNVKVVIQVSDEKDKNKISSPLEIVKVG